MSISTLKITSLIAIVHSQQWKQNAVCCAWHDNKNKKWYRSQFDDLNW